MNNKTTKIYSLGRNIFKKRKQMGYSQNQLAERVNISREHLAKIETAKRTVSLDLLIDIANELKTKKHLSPLVSWNGSTSKEMTH